MSGLGFAQEGLGQLLFHLSEFRLNSHQWIDEQEIVLPKNVFSNFTVSHDLSIYPKEGIPYLQLTVMVGINNVLHQSYWWKILVNLGLDDEQSILCRLWKEAIPSNPQGPDVISEIYRAVIPVGQDGVSTVESACKAAFDHLKATLPTLLPNNLRPLDS